MEDASCRMEGLEVAGCSNDPLAFYCIFDGHGGRTAADFVSQNLVRNITDDPVFAKDPERAMVRARAPTPPALILFPCAFHQPSSRRRRIRPSTPRPTDPRSHASPQTNGFFKTDREFQAIQTADPDDCSGSTALALCVLGEELVVANAGDCRAVLSRLGRAMDLSTDQRPTRSTELTRIEATGGFVEDGYVNGHLGVARAFGDFHIEGLKGTEAKPGPLVVEPEVERWQLTHEDEFVIIACDGLWDVFSSHNAVDFARQALRRHNDPEAAAKELCAEALRRDSADNISVIVVCLSDDPPPDRAPEKRTAPRGIARGISSEGLSELQKALRSDDEAAIQAQMNSPAPPLRRLTRVQSINPSSPSRSNGLGSGFLEALENLEVSVGEMATLEEEG